MAPPGTCRLELSVQRRGDANVAGTLTDEHRRERLFEGWLELVTAIADAITPEAADVDPQAPAG